MLLKRAGLETKTLLPASPSGLWFVCLFRFVLRILLAHSESFRGCSMPLSSLLPNGPFVRLSVSGLQLAPSPRLPPKHGLSSLCSSRHRFLEGNQNNGMIAFPNSELIKRPKAGGTF